MALKKAYKDKALEMAIDDFEKFCAYAGVNSTQLSVCIERERGLSLQQISNKLGVPKTTVDRICNRCFPYRKAEQKPGKT